MASPVGARKRLAVDRQQFLILLRGSFGIDEELDGNVWRHYSDLAQDLADDIMQLAADPFSFFLLRRQDPAGQKP